MYQHSEVISLVMCVISVGFIGRFANRDIPQFRYFYGGLLLMCVSFSAAVAEGVPEQYLFHVIEHLCSALTGVLFAIACLNLYRDEALVQGKAVDLISPSETAGLAEIIWAKDN